MTISAMVTAAVAALPCAPPARAADFDQPSPLGQPVVLFSPNSPAATPPGFTRNTAAAPAKRPAAPVQRAPLDAKPLIPPAPLPAKLGTPPSPRPALPLETELQPLAPPPQAPSAGGSPSPAAKQPAG